MQKIIRDGRHDLTVTKERYTKMQMEIFPEDAEEASCNNIFLCMMVHRFKNGNGMAERSLFREIDIKHF